METDQNYDRVIDDEVKRLAAEKKDQRIIFDSRLAWHFVGQSLKIFTTIDPFVAAERVLASPRGSEESYHDLAEALAKLKIRAELEIKRFKDIYGIDYSDYSNYDLIIDTTWLDPESLASIINQEYKLYAQQDVKPKPASEILISPKSLYPTYPLVRPGKADSNLSLSLKNHFRDDPFVVALIDGYHYVIDDKGGGLFAALEAKLPYVFASLKKDAPETNQTLSKLDPNLLKSAQELGGFMYPGVPFAYGDRTES
jgi:cytidylate kinase